MMKKMHVALRDLVAVLTPILEELVSSDLERRPFVIIKDSVTKKFVQFARRYRPKTGELLFDVPALHIHLRPCASAAAGAEWAAKTLEERFELPPEANLTIIVDGDPTN